MYAAPSPGQSAPTQERTRRHVLSQLVCFGRHTITGLLCCQGRQQEDWSADYRFYSRQRCQPEGLFELIRQEVERAIGPRQALVASMDDSLFHRRGRKVHGTAYRRDPLGPPFHTNLVWSQRFLQLSAAWPQGSEGAARMIPIDFQHAPTARKPGPKADEATQKAYAVQREALSINRVGATRIAALRAQMDQNGSEDRTLIVAFDGRFTNRKVFQGEPPRTVLIGRVRQDAQLYYPPQSQPERGRKRSYGALAPTPEELRQNQRVRWQKVKIYAAGQTRQFKIKLLKGVLTRMRGGDKPVLLVVIAPLGYRLRKNSRVLYRKPAYLLCTDPDLPVQEVVQDFVWRWEIEVNLRDEKTILGVGQAQVRGEVSTQQVPALAIASYALLLVAAAKTLGANGQPEALPLPKWRQSAPPARVSTNRLINQLRYELWAQGIGSTHFSPFLTTQRTAQNGQKCDLDLKSAVFYTSA